MWKRHWILSAMYFSSRKKIVRWFNSKRCICVVVTVNVIGVKKILPSFIKRSQTNYKVSVMGHLTYSNKRNDDEFIRGEFSFSSCGGFPTSSRRSGTWPFSTYRVLNFYVILSLTLPYHEFCCTFEASARGSCRVIYFDLRLNPKSVFVFNFSFGLLVISIYFNKLW